MDPQHHDRTAFLEEAKVAGLFDHDFLPEIDDVQIVEDGDGVALILTNDEARAYLETGVVDAPPTEPDLVRIVIERLGRLRAHRLEDYRRRAGDPAELRNRILAVIERQVDALERTDLPLGGINDSGMAEDLAHLASAHRDLEPAGELVEPVAMTTHFAAAPGLTVDTVLTRRLAGHVYQALQVAGQPAEASEAARQAVIDGLAELALEANA